MTEKNTNYDVKKIERSRKLKYGSNAIIVMISSIVVFVMINLIASWITFEVDLTPEGLYSIGDQTKSILENLTKEVTVYGLFDETKIADDNSYSKIIDLLKKYNAYDNVKVEYVNPNTNVEFMNNLDPDNVLGMTTNNFVVVCGDYKKVLKYYDFFESYASDYNTFGVVDVGSKAELSLTSAINYVSRDERTTILFSNGHDEFTDDYDYIAVSEKFTLNGFKIGRINLYNESIPDEADIIVIANPTSDLYPEEVKKLKEFMAAGNSVYVLMDCMITNDRFTNLQSFLYDYNVQLGYDKIKEYDTDFYLEGNQYYIFPELIRSDVNEPIYENFTKLMAPNARSINILRILNNNLSIQPLLITSEKTKLEGIYDDIKDFSGAAYVAVAVTDSTTNAKLLLSGTASFMQDQILINYSQYDAGATKFMLNNLNWLEGETSEMFIEQKDFFVNSIIITTKQANTVGGFLVYGLPSLILLAGLIVYLRRRHL
ncbi:MAG: GldG family protein [Clostridia bacterium]|nr:GldG family protein [Clostridia bacterium]